MYLVTETSEVLCDPCAALIAEEQTGPETSTGTAAQAPAGAVHVHGWTYDSATSCDVCGEVAA